MRNVAIIQARMGSSRLPGKVLLPLADKTVLAHVINRVSSVPQIDEVVIATTINSIDDPIVEEATRLGASVYRGSEGHVLSRYYEAAIRSKADTVVRITSDCPVIDPAITDAVITFYNEQAVDYASNTIERTFPRGLDTEVFSMESLERAYHEANTESQFEHVTPYLYQHPELFKLAFFTGKEDHSEHRWTLDTAEDYQLLTEIYNRLYSSNQMFHWKEVLELMHENPDLLLINAHIEQKKLNE
ncbi:glycosyltransferase family protein [Paenibacillus oenotherae]|uniref:Glycosyltransferase family protein n=1 Tax=Paenibacillus oenotherae TaxID=1435645 RepID=A0ABS7D4W3_9BACL|nr:glycosyltransferase family protein [Paenibacillus oenotherae]MBW7474982.1 glycosyltransferase family protein [Paenibacillus oenotherae]